MTNSRENKFRTDDELIVDALKKAYSCEAKPNKRLEQLMAALQKEQRAMADT